MIELRHRRSAEPGASLWSARRRRGWDSSPMAAVGNAIHDALDGRMTELPMSPIKVLEALNENDGQRPSWHKFIFLRASRIDRRCRARGSGRLHRPRPY